MFEKGTEGPFKVTKGDWTHSRQTNQISLLQSSLLFWCKRGFHNWTSGDGNLKVCPEPISSRVKTNKKKVFALLLLSTCCPVGNRLT